MKKFLFPLLLLISIMSFAQHSGHSASGLGYADSINTGLIKMDTFKGSPMRMAMANIGDAHVHIAYGSPGVRGRNIWGGLVSYDEVWVAGAHSATKISFSKPVVISNKKIEAGTYGLFIIPKRDKWIFIINTKAEMHLVHDYNEKNDVVRVDVVPTELSKELPRLTYEVVETKKGQGEIRLMWEKKSIAVAIRAM